MRLLCLGAVLWATVRVRIRGEGSWNDRGDVPGWVMVTVMTAGIVVAVFAVFRNAVLDAVTAAIEGVVSTTGG